MKILSDDDELSVSYRYKFKEKGIEVVYRNILPVRPNHEKNYCVQKIIDKTLYDLCANALTGFIYNIQSCINALSV
jgi:hypothetical protein